MTSYSFLRPIPPAPLKKHRYHFFIKPFFDLLCRISHDNCVRRDIFAYDGLRSNDSAITDGHTGEYGGSIAYPDIIADNYIAFRCRMAFYILSLRPIIGKGRERVRRYPIRAMISS